jgi:hypothetical protein
LHKFTGRSWYAALGGMALAAVCGMAAAAQPGTGLVVDGQGSVYFADTGQGPWKIDASGKVAAQDGPPWDYLAADPDGRFAGVQLPAASPVNMKHAGHNPMLIFSSVPVAIGSDGALYFPAAGQDGRLQIVRLLPSGTHTVLATLPATSEDGPLQSINGIAPGPDNSVYYTENKAIRRVTKEGMITTIASSVVVPDCVRPPGSGEKSGPLLRGLDVAPDGTIFAAASACGAIVRVSGQGEVTPVLRTVTPWSPTGVALKGRDLYALEYQHNGSDERRSWLPRVRKLAEDGKISLLAEIRRR